MLFILLIKSFALSQVLYATSVLPTSNIFLAELEEIIYNFLWNGKAHKVKKCVIIQSYENGGQNMISVHDMIKAQRITWMQKYLNNIPSYWKSTMECIMKIHKLDIFLQSNFSIPKHISEFYRSVLQSWKDIQYDKVHSIADIKEQYLWYNQCIPSNSNKSDMQSYINSGIIRMKDIIKGNGSFKSIQEMTMEYNIDHNSFLFYQSIINAIPKHWKSILKGNGKLVKNITDEDPSSNKYDIIKTPYKQIYNDLVINKKGTSKANVKYSVMFDISDEQWQTYYKLYIKTKVSNKAKENQYKILHDYVATQKLLYKINVLDSPRCNFCELYIQDTCHLYAECMEVKNFWFRLKEWFESEYNENVSLDTKDILFGKSEVSEFQNKIFMYAKLFIFKSKYKNDIPNYNAFRAWMSKFIDL